MKAPSCFQTSFDYLLILCTEKSNQWSFIILSFYVTVAWSWSLEDENLVTYAHYDYRSLCSTRFNHQIGDWFELAEKLTKWMFKKLPLTNWNFYGTTANAATDTYISNVLLTLTETRSAVKYASVRKLRTFGMILFLSVAEWRMKNCSRPVEGWLVTSKTIQILLTFLFQSALIPCTCITSR